MNDLLTADCRTLIAKNSSIEKKRIVCLVSPDCSGILLRNEVQQKIQRKAGQNLKRSKNFLASHKINKKYISENEINE